MSGMKVMVTAGPTHEYIDPVRYISNRAAADGVRNSKGRMVQGSRRDARLRTGVAAKARRCQRVIDVVSADQMYEACVGKRPQWTS